MKALVLLIAVLGIACGSTDGSQLTSNANAAGDGGTLGFGAEDRHDAGCVNLECKQGNPRTRIDGIVYDPKGLVPLYNVFVYIPNAPLDPLTSGPVCEACQAPASGKPLVSTTTDENGHFMLTNVPSGDGIPIVMQLGKWRRNVTVTVKEGVDNSFNTKLDPKNDKPETLMRLPRRQAEGSPNDNIPLMAVTTGACDYGECFLMNTIGIDAKEFDVGGRVHIYDGVGGETAYPHTYGNSVTALFDDEKTLMQYDLVFISCECSTFDRGTGYANIATYLNGGGRLFGTHYAYNFFASQTQCATASADATCKGDSDFNGVAHWSGDDGATYYAPPYRIDQSFPKGAAFATWLQNLQGGTLGEIDLVDTRGDVDMVTSGKGTRWIYSDGPGGNPDSAYSTVYLTFNTPVNDPPAAQCGRAVFSDVHVAGTSAGFCAAQDPTYAPNLNALEFLFFDLASCVQKDTDPPIAPPPN